MDNTPRHNPQRLRQVASFHFDAYDQALAYKKMTTLNDEWDGSTSKIRRRQEGFDVVVYGLLRPGSSADVTAEGGDLKEPKSRSKKKK